MIVGEAPGEDEDQQGAPFVGRAGKVLDELLHALSIRRKECYVTNVVKCRPIKDGANRAPHKAEVVQCLPTLQREIKRVQPTAILCLGNVPLQALTGSDKRITRDHGRVFSSTEGITTIGTYHPSYLLRLGKGKEKVQQCIADIRLAWSFALGKAGEEKYAESLLQIEDYKPGLEPLKSEFLGFDLEWVGENPWVGEIISASISAGNRVVYFTKKYIKSYLMYMLRCRGILTGHAISNDLLWIMVQFCHADSQIRELMSRRFCDSLLLCHLYDHRTEPKALKYLCETKLGWHLMERPFDKDPRDCDPKILRTYNCLDSWGGVALSKWLLNRIKGKMVGMAEFLCFEMLPTTTFASFAGMFIGQKRLREVMMMYDKRVVKNEALMKTLAPGIDLESTDHVFQHVFGDLDLPLQGTVSTARWRKKPAWADETNWDDEANRPLWSPTSLKPRWNKEVKAALKKRDKTGFVKAIVRRDRARKFRNTYLENFVKLTMPDGCVHPRFVIAKYEQGVDDSDPVKAAGSKTGRPTMVQPGFATIPKKSPIKSIIISRFKNGYILAADYSQVELRVAADLAQCERMMEIFADDKLDLHRAMAAELFRKSYKSVSDKERSRGKTINFAIIYGCTPYKLCQVFAQYGDHLSKREARIFIDRWYKANPEIKEYQEETANRVIRDGYIETPTGRREYIFADRQGSEGRKGIRMAVNARIQSGASEIANEAFAQMQRVFLESQFFGYAVVIGHVYDALVMDTQGRLLNKIKEISTEILTDAEALVGDLGWHMTVPLKVDFKEGRCLT